MKRWVRDVMLADAGAAIAVGYWVLTERQWLVGSAVILCGLAAWYVTHKTPEEA